jgi:enoyl-CoA hydratase/carnithine racemase
VLEAALALARAIAQRPRLAVAHVKRLVRMVAGQGLAEGLAAERTLFCDLMVSAESIARMAEMNAGRRAITG